MVNSETQVTVDGKGFVTTLSVHGGRSFARHDCEKQQMNCWETAKLLRQMYEQMGADDVSCKKLELTVKPTAIVSERLE